jgi:hypothetical protein
MWVMLDRVYRAICVERIAWRWRRRTYVLLGMVCMCVIARPRGLVLDINMVGVACELVRNCGRLRRVEHGIWASAISQEICTAKRFYKTYVRRQQA